MRNKEGAIIEKEFYGYMDIAKKDLIKIEKIQEKVHSSKINLKSNNDVIDEIEKIDISEEIDRINSHLSQISQSKHAISLKMQAEKLKEQIGNIL